MNMYRSFLKISVIVLAMISNAVSLGMIVRYKDEQSKKAIQASISSCLKPIYEKEKEKVKALSLEEQGQYNLEKLYRNRHKLEFVQKFLSDKDNYVPVMLVHNVVNVNPEKVIELDFFIVDSYHASFYDPYRESFFSGSNEKIRKIGGERFRKALKKKRINCINKNPSVYKITCSSNGNHPLVTASLFGNDEDVQKELRSNSSDPRSNPNGEAMHSAVLASINYPNKKNNALELLLAKIKQTPLDVDIAIDEKDARIALSYQLLGASADNKKVFKLIARKDPYNANMIKVYNPDDHKQYTT